MDYDALVAKFGKEKADQIMEQFTADPRLREFTPSRINEMAMQNYRQGVTGTIQPRDLSIGDRVQKFAQGALEFIGMDPQDAMYQARKFNSASDFAPITGDIAGFESAGDQLNRAEAALERENYAQASIHGGLGAVEGLLSAIGAAGVTKVPVNAARQGVRKLATSMLDHVAAAPRTLNTPNFKGFELQPNYAAQQAAFDHSRKTGIPYYPPTEYAPVDQDFATRVATEYDLMKRDPEGLWRSAKNPTEAEKNIWEAGYSGYNAVDERLGNTIQLFDPMSATKKIFTPPSIKTGSGSKLINIGGKVHDPRFLKSGAGADFSGAPRAGDMERIAGLNLSIGNNRMGDIPTIGLDKFEGSPFMVSMSDRTAAGDDLLGVNNIKYDQPVSRRGGQDYMFDSDGQVWASDRGVITGGPSKMHEVAGMLKQQTGKDPLFLPWTMAPTGGDFSQTSQVMLAHARNNMDKKTIASLNKDIRGIFPEFKGVENPDSMTQIYTDMSGKQRFKMMDIMDKKYRDKGSLTSGEARLAITDPDQLNTPDTRLRNIGMVDPKSVVIDQSGHPVYNTGLAGEGLGRLDRNISAWELMPDQAEVRGIKDLVNPTRQNIRPLEMKPYFGIIDEEILKKLNY